MAIVDRALFGIGDWDPEGVGFHRVVLRVAEAAAAVRARFAWRRRDREPGKRALLVTTASGEPIANVHRLSVTREECDLLFEPSSGAGEYHLYWAPYSGSIHSPYPKVEYPEPSDSPDPAWVAMALNVRAAPLADVVSTETSGEFNAFSDMELPARQDELAKLLESHAGEPFLVFAEDRDRPVRMARDIPERWIQAGPSACVEFVAAPGEYRVFQVGIYALKDLQDVRVTCGPLANGVGAIGAEAFDCINLGGVGWDGVPFTKRADIPSGRVLALWCGVQTPEGAAQGAYEGRLTARANGCEPREITLRLVVEGEPVPDSGDGEPHRLSRLRWLNSTLGSEPEVHGPYVPVEAHGRTLGILGRRVEVGEWGLPKRIVSTFSPEVTEADAEPVELLAGPMRLVAIDGAGSECDWTDCEVSAFELEEDQARWTGSAKSGVLSVRAQAILAFDGMVEHHVTMSAHSDLRLADLRLELPLRPEAARYMTGLGRKGGVRPDGFEWSWDAERNQDSVWLGDVNAGLQLSLRDDAYSRPLNTNFYHLKPLVLPRVWHNEGRGGIRLQAGEDAYLVTCFSGPLALAAGEEVRLDFRLLLTPFKPIDTARQFGTRFFHDHKPPAEVVERGANTINIHHATAINPYINYPFLRDEELTEYVREAHRHGCKVKLYYTVRELTTRAPELFALRSLDGEVIVRGPGGGHPWLQEHLEEDYIAAWHAEPTEDASVINGVLSRWHNYYVEGMDWLARKLEIDGVYLDDVGFGREVLQRAWRVLHRRRPDPVIDLHSANQYNPRDGFASSANLYMELMPYLDRLWFGEYFDYDESPDYWLVEVSGIPFGLMGEMLQDGGNPWRGMVYGMTGRMPGVDNEPLWRFWDESGLAQSRMLGYWSPRCPVSAGREDVLATAYVRKGKSAVIALASWAPKPVEARLAVDWSALGLEPGRFLAPAVADYQPEAYFAVDDAIPVEPGRGWLLVTSDG